MFTRSDLATLTAEAPEPAVSIFLPTHPASSDSRQDPIRLKNLTARARDILVASGLERSRAESILEPAIALVEDHRFWQELDEGLALFLSGDGRQHRFTVPIELPEDVVVASRFHISPLLPLLEGDGSFYVLTVTADRVCLYTGTRFALEHLTGAELPASILDSLGETDYENPVNASPPNRPHTGTANISNAQVYGDSPREWRKTRLVEFASRVGAALDRVLAGSRRPVVLVAGAELSGQLKDAHSFDATIEQNPESLSITQLRDASYQSLQAVLDVGRARAQDRYNTLTGRGDSRATGSLRQIVNLAIDGRVEALLVGEGSAESTGWSDPAGASDPVDPSAEPARSTGELLSAAIAATLLHGGEVHTVSDPDGADPRSAGAVLRY
ncbi:hypothetical protein B0I08_101753 [Glaciihabitans tibetensis]|uniref:Peptide subunit release factor 1 (ERF1) n=1 Tax=Glaciihabitans tibetensis TaxID=1266600 RepID=A0A2T0VK60_9MICO|nr:hypothetical protein [Glaciihabitans tibetensis]PRY70616.1 hypothetical protein B0I08_101753 [Glaciihabitans tibetensis]